MVQINMSTREITVKVVYYGPARSGKTTNLVMLHELMNAEARGNMKVSAAASILKNAASTIAQKRAELILELMGNRGLGWEGDGYTGEEIEHQVRGGRVGVGETEPGDAPRVDVDDDHRGRVPAQGPVGLGLAGGDRIARNGHRLDAGFGSRRHLSGLDEGGTPRSSPGSSGGRSSRHPGPP